MATQSLGIRGLGSAATAGLALAVGAVALLSAQQRRLEDVRRQLDRLEQQVDRSQRHADLAHQQRLHWELLSKAIDDPALAAVLDTYDGTVPPDKHRQFLFVNAWYVHAFRAYTVGILTRDELFGHLRGMFQNPVVREYWEATRPHRATLEQDSDEAQVGRMVDNLIHDLDEAETEEWWVVGEPPAS